MRVLLPLRKNDPNKTECCRFARKGNEILLF
jgi:hypothetical protein